MPIQKKTQLSRQLQYQKHGQFEETCYEKIHNMVFENRMQASKLVAREIAAHFHHKLGFADYEAIEAFKLLTI